MTLGEQVYLLSVIATFTGFGLVLAYYTHLQAKLDRAMAAREAAKAPAHAEPRAA